MKIKASSWHYKLQDKVAPWDVPKNLCWYFWSLVAMCVVAPFMITVSAILVPFIWANNIASRHLKRKQYTSWSRDAKLINAGTPSTGVRIKQFIATYPKLIVLGITTWLTVAITSNIVVDIAKDAIIIEISGIAMIAAMFFMLIGFILGMITLAIGTATWWKIFKVRYKMPERKRERQPSIFLAYLKAKKEKVCPLIEIDYEV